MSKLGLMMDMQPVLVIFKNGYLAGLCAKGAVAS